MATWPGVLIFTPRACAMGKAICSVRLFVCYTKIATSAVLGT